MRQLRVFFFTYGFNYKTYTYDIFRKDCKLCKLAKTSLRPWPSAIESVCKPMLKSSIITGNSGSSSPYLMRFCNMVYADRKLNKNTNIW